MTPGYPRYVASAEGWPDGKWQAVTVRFDSHDDKKGTIVARCGHHHQFARAAVTCREKR